MPRKRRTANPEKAPKVWIAPEWPARLHESRSSHALSSDFSRYLDLADRVLANQENDLRRAKVEEPAGQNGAGRHGQTAPLPDIAEALLGSTSAKVVLPKPPKRPASPKPRKLEMPKPPVTPKLDKPRKMNFPKPPRRNW
jgi:hypothetical protein